MSEGILKSIFVDFSNYKHNGRIYPSNVFDKELHKLFMENRKKKINKLKQKCLKE